jgi:deazaflavin-dependent oxidoreductase (nitroreductase family)
MGGLPLLLLTTTGRRSGRSRTTPVQYMCEGDAYLVVASANGARRPPAWYRNLMATPEAIVQLGSRQSAVRAREVTGEERTRLFGTLARTTPRLAVAQRRARRSFPLVLLEESPPAQDIHASGQSRSPS